MSAVAGAPPMAPSTGAPSGKAPMSEGKKLLYAILGAWIGGIVLFIILFGFKSHKAPAVASGVFSRQRVQTRHLVQARPGCIQQGCSVSADHGRHHDRGDDLIARRPKQRPGRLQTAVEMFYEFTRRMSRENLDESMERK